METNENSDAEDTAALVIFLVCLLALVEALLSTNSMNADWDSMRKKVVEVKGSAFSLVAKMTMYHFAQKMMVEM